MKTVSVLLAGILFGIGLMVSGMANPMKVLNFMDLFGSFDPTLIFVMGGGLLTTLIGYQLVFRRKTPLFADKFYLPTSTGLDWKLVTGAALFGLGWGMTGFCPGPAIASAVLGYSQTFMFLAAMVAGMLVCKVAVK
jgi:uncharacterized membrane protein YedE/YeeE